ncbi:aldehyde oxidase GLOX [Amborella trichopoda]|uniref:Aldehyde oxidase GLOX n=1 Tax=Amborella trichopoda TaxID=13333 RepID=W1PVA0_AMBTC|nr:aldehyde oxidase GLOX [Amborella trichopoda]ERN12018.1 hypothetical protein AMTR_s00165p00057230 [Amborella trichopoda]|eukprot:XP_006850437.1 aldehyde oxidase GLOX [Amborella trichopoda]
MASITLFLFSVISSFIFTSNGDLPGKWELLLQNAGISSMHTAVTRFGTVVLLDRTNIGPTKLKLPRGNCRYDPRDATLKLDCYAHSAIFDPASNQIRPLKILTDTWCSSGGFLPNGTLLQTGGDLDGNRKVRLFEPCSSGSYCDWMEIPDYDLAVGRWYSTNQILPEGHVIIVGGRGTHTVEFYPPNMGTITELPFLLEAEDAQMDNLYPYVHLLPNGRLFIFANTKSILYDYNLNRVVHVYPELQGGPRNYPSAGSSAMLALTPDNEHSTAEVVVCGGATYGAFIQQSTDAPANGSCGRIVATDLEATWQMEEMPFVRIMGDMVMLPTGHLLIINGAQAGSQGFNLASSPCLNPVLYRPEMDAGLRFMTLNPATVPRMYHSTAVLLPDGRILTAGSNPNYFYSFKGDFPTELRIEAFSPEYLSPDRQNLRPVISKTPSVIRYSEQFEVQIKVPLPVVEVVEINFASAPFATHSFSQGQRLVKLSVSSAHPSISGAISADSGGYTYTISCTAPPNGAVAPPSYYMMFAVNQGVPSVASWIHLIN